MSGAILQPPPGTGLTAADATLHGIGRAVTTIPLDAPVEPALVDRVRGRARAARPVRRPPSPTCSSTASASGATTTPSSGRSTSRATIGGSASPAAASSSRRSLLLLGAEWRGAVNRVAETVALLCRCRGRRSTRSSISAGHGSSTGTCPTRTPTASGRSSARPLFWDAIDIVSLPRGLRRLWYIGMLPDLAACATAPSSARASRRRAVAAGAAFRKAQVYGIAALGWRGSAAHWQRWVQAYRTLALLGVLLVVSLQTGASVMFAGSVEPGWHDTMLRSTFLVERGVVRRGRHRRHRHADPHGLPARRPRDRAPLEILARLMLGLGCASIYCYATEFFSTFLARRRATIAAC